MTRMIFRDKLNNVPLKVQRSECYVDTLHVTWSVQSSGYSRALNTVLWQCFCALIVPSISRVLNTYFSSLNWCCEWLLPTNHFTEWPARQLSQSASQSVSHAVTVLQDYFDRGMECGTLSPPISVSLSPSISLLACFWGPPTKVCMQ